MLEERRPTATAGDGHLEKDPTGGCDQATGYQDHDHAQPASRITSSWKRFEKQLVVFHLEARGIQRVEDDDAERIRLSWISYVQVFLLWVSINLAANTISLGMLGPAVFELSFLDSSLCAVLGASVGSLPVAWIATWGPVSGNRTMVSKGF